MTPTKAVLTCGILMLAATGCGQNSNSPTTPMSTGTAQSASTPTPPSTTPTVTATMTGETNMTNAAPNPALLDNFESYPLGHVDEVTGGVWTSHSYLGKPTAGFTQIASEPNGNKFGQIGGGDTDPHDAYGIRRLLKNKISKSNTATTLYIRVMTEQAITNGSFGLSDAALPINYDSFKIQIRFLDGSISLRNGLEFTGNLFEIKPRTWYNVWAVVDSSTDSYDLYATAEGDATGVAPVASHIKFRVPVTAKGPVVAGELVSFWGFSSHRKTDVPSNRIRVDNIAIMEGVNLTVPQ